MEGSGGRDDGGLRIEPTEVVARGRRPTPPPTDAAPTVVAATVAAAAAAAAAAASDCRWAGEEKHLICCATARATSMLRWPPWSLRVLLLLRSRCSGGVECCQVHTTAARAVSSDVGAAHASAAAATAASRGGRVTGGPASSGRPLRRHKFALKTIHSGSK